MEPFRIYVAGPYSPSKNCDSHNIPREVQHNVDKAIIIGNEIHELGHYAFVPHLSHYMHINPSSKTDFGTWYYELDNTFIDYWANALFYISPSYGTDMELCRSKLRGYKIFYNLYEIPNINNYKENQ